MGAPVSGAFPSKWIFTNALAGRFAEMHAGDDLLADVAAFFEIDAVHHIEVDVMHKGIAIGKIGAALRHALGDPMRLVGGLASVFDPRPALHATQ